MTTKQDLLTQLIKNNNQLVENNTRLCETTDSMAISLRNINDNSTPTANALMSLAISNEDNVEMQRKYMRNSQIFTALIVLILLFAVLLMAGVNLPAILTALKTLIPFL